MQPPITFPDESSLAWPKVGLSRKQWMALGELEEHVYEMNSGRYNQLLGHSTNLQDGMERQCTRMAKQFFVLMAPKMTEGVVAAIGQQRQRVWHDVGRLWRPVFLDTQEDLQQQRFERCWCVMQCFSEG